MIDEGAKSGDESDATITVLTFGDEEHKFAALSALRHLIVSVDGLRGLEQVVVVDAGPREACMIPFYCFEAAAAERASASATAPRHRYWGARYGPAATMGRPGRDRERPGGARLKVTEG